MNHLLALTLIDQLGTVKIGKLLNFYGTAEKVFEDRPVKISNSTAIPLNLAIQIEKSLLEKADDIINWCRDFDISIITINDKNYPPILKELYSPPLILYVLGDLSVLSTTSVAIVGMRDSSNYGNSTAYNTSKELAQNGITVISGLAFGIDKQAHRGALDGGGKTIAVLGTGLDTIYPAAHRELAIEISQNGALISENRPKSNTYKHSFIRRNRIISGLSKATIVIEAAERSGALSTASFALEQNRELFVLPGRITDRESIGTNKLILDGATPLLSTKDLLGAIEVDSCNTEIIEQVNMFKDINFDNYSENEHLILKYIEKSSARLDELIDNIELNKDEIFEVLFDLEMSGVITQEPGQKYGLIKH